MFGYPFLCCWLYHLSKRYPTEFFSRTLVLPDSLKEKNKNPMDCLGNPKISLGKYLYFPLGIDRKANYLNTAFPKHFWPLHYFCRFLIMPINLQKKFWVIYMVNFYTRKMTSSFSHQLGPTCYFSPLDPRFWKWFFTRVFRKFTQRLVRVLKYWQEASLTEPHYSLEFPWITDLKLGITVLRRNCLLKRYCHI